MRRLRDVPRRLVFTLRKNALRRLLYVMGVSKISQRRQIFKCSLRIKTQDVFKTSFIRYKRRLKDVSETACVHRDSSKIIFNTLNTEQNDCHLIKD